MTLLSINFDAEVLNVEGGSYDDHPTLRLLSISALQHFAGRDEGLSLGEKAAIFALAVKVARGGTVALTMEEFILLRRRIGENMPALVMGRMFELLELPAAGPEGGQKP